MGEKVIGRRSRLGEFLIAPVAVVADGRCRHEHCGLRVGLKDALHEVPRADDTTVADSGFLSRRPPSLSNRFASEMKDGVDPFEGLLGRRPLERIPADDPAGKVADRLPGAVGIPGDDGRSVEHPQQPRSDEPRATGDQGPHVDPPRPCLPRGRKALRARLYQTAREV